MSDGVGFGAMLFGPEHALQLAATTIERNSRTSTDMAVGICLGIRAAIVEYQRLFTPTESVPADTRTEEETRMEKSKPSPESKEDKASRRVGALSGA
jgi:hypothetical protein